MDALRQRIRQRSRALLGRQPETGLGGILDSMAKKKGFDSFKAYMKAEQAKKEAEATYASPVFPDTPYFHTGYKPEGADAAVDKLLKGGFPQLVAILQSGADAIGVKPEQISIFKNWVRPAAPGPRETAYAAKLSREHGIVLGGDPSASRITQEAFKQGLREGLKEAAKELAIDMAVNIIPMPPAVPAAAIAKVAIDFVDNKDLLKTTAGRQQAVIGAGLAVASFVPVVNVLAFTGQAVMSVVGIGKAKDHAKAEAGRAQAFGQMVQGMVDIAMEEITALAEALAERNVRILSAPDPAWLGRLQEHYRLLEILMDTDEFEANAAKKKSGGPFAKLMASVVEKKAETLGRTEKLTFFLQIARDARRVREALLRNIDLKGTQWKDAATIASEINRIAYEMLLQDPALPLQQVLNLASATARKVPEPMTPQAETVVAIRAVEKVTELKSQRQLISAGAMGLVGLAAMFWR